MNLIPMRSLADVVPLLLQETILVFDSRIKKPRCVLVFQRPEGAEPNIWLREESGREYHYLHSFYEGWRYIEFSGPQESEPTALQAWVDFLRRFNIPFKQEKYMMFSMGNITAPNCYVLYLVPEAGFNVCAVFDTDKKYLGIVWSERL